MGAQSSGSLLYLLAVGPDESPAALAQRYAALLGVKPGSRGFVVGTDPRGVTDHELADIVAVEPGVAQIVRPYLSGDDLMSTPQVEPTRRIVDCGDFETAR